MRLALFLTSATFLLGITSAFPAYQSLAGWSREEVDLFIREHGKSLVGAKPSPPALKDTSSKLVHDAKHPYVAPGPNDLRGPCPGLNTLANHGVSLIFQFDKGPPTYPPIKYLAHSGIVTPQEIVTAVQEGKLHSSSRSTRQILISNIGFNMEWEFATFVTWMAFLVDGNLLTNLVSLGPKSDRTGVDPPSPAIVGGLNTHGVFEGVTHTLMMDHFY